MRQFQIRHGLQIETLAAQITPTGVWLLSTFSGNGAEEASEIHISAAAGDWLLEVAETLILRKPGR
jgi:hypothetical protein